MRISNNKAQEKKCMNKLFARSVGLHTKMLYVKLVKNLLFQKSVKQRGGKAEEGGANEIRIEVNVWWNVKSEAREAKPRRSTSTVLRWRSC